MPAQQAPALDDRLRALVRESAGFWPALCAAQKPDLRAGCTGAGAVHNLVWGHLHGFSDPSALADVDEAYFDASDLGEDRDAALQAALHDSLPDVL